METKEEHIQADKPSLKAAPLVEFVVRNRQLICPWMVAIGILLGIAALVCAFWVWPWAFTRVLVLGIGLALAALITGISPFIVEPQKGQEQTYARAMILMAGGLTGLVITVGGFMFSWTWWADIVSWLSPTAEGKNIGHLIIAMLTLLGGQILMFVSAQIARGEERTSPTFRRILYGYTAGLTGLTLLTIVVLVTVLVAVRVKAPLDFTASGDFTISQKSINILRSLNVPVEVTFIHGFENFLLERQVETLLENCQNHTDKLTVKELHVQQDQAKARALFKTYQGIEPGSLLLIFTPPGADKEQHRIITEDKMTAAPDMFSRGQPREHKFTGEDALMTALNNLAEDKELPVIYFTQGHNELDPADIGPDKLGTACGQLKRRLEQRKTFEIKTLTFDAVRPKVPEKAAVVAIIGPRQPPFTHGEVKALRDYMAKGGKMLVMLDLIVNSEKKVVPTGLEEFLGEHGVGLSNDRVITLPIGFEFGPTDVIAMMNRKYIMQNPLVGPFANDRFELTDVRPLQSLGDKPGGRFLTMPLMGIMSFSWTDENLAGNPGQIVQGLLRNEEALEKKIGEIQMAMKTRGPLSVAVAVTEAGNDPHAGIAGPANPAPRMLVIGSAGMAANRFMDERNPKAQYFDLLASAFEWLRGKDQNIGIEAKVNKPFMLSTKSDSELKRIIFLPPVLVVGVVLGLATGVWIVRRR